MEGGKDYFLEASGIFEKTLNDAMRMSENRMGIVHTGRQNRVLISFAKTIAHATSIHLLYDSESVIRSQSGFLDHFSIGTLTRALIDTAIMTLYLSEPSLSLAEWDLRRHVLFRHDLANRKRFLTAMRKNANETEPKSDQEEYKRAKAHIVSVIETRGNELSLSDARIEELSKGQIVFIDGVRGALREAGLDVDFFDFIHTYLSNYTHGHPVSYLRAHEHGISFDNPSDAQFGICALCLEAGAKFLEPVTDRVGEFTGDMSRDANGHIE